MEKNINVDPFSANPINDSINSSPIYNNVPSMNNLQSIMKMQLMNKVMSNITFLQTGNQSIDTVILTLIQALLISLVSIFVSQMGSFMKIFSSSSNRLLILLKQYMYIVWCKIFKKRKVYPRMVDIPYISDTRQINELYKAIFWYLTHDTEIDYLHEPFLQYIFDKKITLENKDVIKNNLTIHKILTQHKIKSIKYKNHEIKYSLSTDLITVYTDKDRKRENYKVTLWTTVDEIEKTDILDDFSQHCLTEYIKNLTSSIWSQLIYVNKNGKWESSPSNNTRKMDTIILNNSLKDNIKSDLQLFLNSEEWYKDRDIPYTRGYMFYGHPGTGKTSMIKGMSLYCKRHIHFLMLSEVNSDSELFELLKNINYKDSILVIEDIDATLKLVKSRDIKNVESEDSEDYEDTDSDKKKKKREEKEESKLTLSGLLNAIDGVFTCHGRILIMTTNHPEVLDAALIRAGRIDSKYLFDNCTPNQIRGLYEMFFNKSVDEEQLMNIKDKVYSPAHITSVFLRYRNQPEEALNHLDDEETKIVIPN